MSKFIWYIALPVNGVLAVIANWTHSRKGGLSYWWGIAKEVHEETWGKL